MSEEKRVALVTGSSAGIGRAIASTLAARGMRLVINSARSVREGQEFADSLPDAIYVQADVADPQAAQRLVDTAVEHYGRLDVLVNNAGTTKLIAHDDFDAVTPELWQEILSLNVVGTWQVTVAALPHLRASGQGAVVNMSSVAGTRPAGSCIPYSVSKAAIDHMTRLLARVVGPEVRVNAVAPGVVNTGWTTNFTAIKERTEQVVPLRRIAEPDDVAGVVSALTDANYTTGEVVLIDGGAHLLI
jgi:ketoreductase RED2